MVFTLSEIIGLIVTAVVIGIIFSEDIFSEEVLRNIPIAGLSVVLHELFHKFMAIILGYSATYMVCLPGLLLGLILKLFGSPIIIVLPGGVLVKPTPPPLGSFLISLAGPLANLLLYFIGKLVLKNEYLAKLNLYLFIINMIPVPPLDGFKVATSLYKIITGHSVCPC